MKAIIGLGNIGASYEKTRHNVGFLAVDDFIHEYSGQEPVFKSSKRHNADVLELDIDSQKVLFAKPTTFMNNSGLAIASIMQFYKITVHELLIIHDDIDLPFGSMRVRKGGGDGGHNGIRSLSQTAKDTARLRIGIANEFKNRQETAEFVLSRFTSEEITMLPSIFHVTNSFIQLFLSEKLAAQTQTIFEAD